MKEYALCKIIRNIHIILTCVRVGDVITYYRIILNTWEKVNIYICLVLQHAIREMRASMGAQLVIYIIVIPVIEKKFS